MRRMTMLFAALLLLFSLGGGGIATAVEAPTPSGKATSTTQSKVPVKDSARDAAPAFSRINGWYHARTSDLYKAMAVRDVPKILNGRRRVPASRQWVTKNTTWMLIERGGETPRNRSWHAYHVPPGWYAVERLPGRWGLLTNGGKSGTLVKLDNSGWRPTLLYCQAGVTIERCDN